MSSMKGVEAALLQAEGVMKQLDEAAEELFMRVRHYTGQIAWVVGVRCMGRKGQVYGS